MKSRIDLIILSFLYKEGIECMAKAVTAKELPVEDMGVKINTVQKRLKALADIGYVSLGYKDCQSNTYFISGKGKEVLEEAKRK